MDGILCWCANTNIYEDDFHLIVFVVCGLKLRFVIAVVVGEFCLFLFSISDSFHLDSASGGKERATSKLFFHAGAGQTRNGMTVVSVMVKDI